MGKLYGTDMSDAAWALVEPHLPAPMPDGRPRTTCLRSVVNAIFYLLRTGCQWRLLPLEFPPRSTVYQYKGQKSGQDQAARQPVTLKASRNPGLL